MWISRDEVAPTSSGKVCALERGDDVRECRVSLDLPYLVH